SLVAGAPARCPVVDGLRGGEDGGYALAAGGADGDQAAAGAAFVEEFGEGGDEAAAGGGEGVAGGEGGAVDVELGAVDRAERGVQAQAFLGVGRVFPGFEGGQDLGGERFVDLVEVEVLEGQAGAGEHAGDGVHGGHEQTL